MKQQKGHHCRAAWSKWLKAIQGAKIRKRMSLAPLASHINRLTLSRTGASQQKTC